MLTSGTNYSKEFTVSIRIKKQIKSYLFLAISSNISACEILSKYLDIDITKWKPVEIQKEIILDNILPLFERIK